MNEWVDYINEDITSLGLTLRVGPSNGLETDRGKWRSLNAFLLTKRLLLTMTMTMTTTTTTTTMMMMMMMMMMMLTTMSLAKRLFYCVFTSSFSVIAFIQKPRN